jgi:DNA-binding protein HU-beta
MMRGRAGGKSVNRNELVDAVAGKTELRKSEASRAVDAVFESISEALKAGDEVRLVGFGTFSVSARAASEGRNPRTGEKIKIAASKQPKFKPGKGLRDSLN